MFFPIFHHEPRRVFFGLRGQESSFGHTFGGAADYLGLTFIDETAPVHLLSRLNTADPAVGISLPGIQWLPLLCAIRYGACDLGYQVVSNTEVKILLQSNAQPWDGFPYPGFPEKLFTQTVALRKIAYDPTDPDDALWFGGVFGYGLLTSEQLATVARHVLEKELYCWGISDCDSVEEFLRQGGSISPFVQSPPVDDCPNTRCSNHRQRGSLRTFAIFQEDDEKFADLWGPHCDNLQIIYQICPLCQAIQTTNQCT